MGGGPADPLGTFGQIRQVTWEPGLEITPVLSPDGKTVVYAAGNGTQFRLFIRSVAGGRATPLTDDSISVEAFPEWSAASNKRRA